MNPEVEVTELVKRYPKRDVNAVDGLSFAVERSEIFGLLGPNGAGKSTTIGVLTTRVKATSGAARVAGVDVVNDPVEARRMLAVVPQGSNLDRSLTPRQNLTFHAAYHGFGQLDRNARAATMLEEFGLDAQADIKVDWYSGGMAQRLMIARAMMHEPRVLFLDEPTSGLDPQSRLFMWERVRQLREKGVTIVLTTHDMDEAAEMSDRVGIVDHGKLLALDTPSSLIRGLGGQAVLEVTINKAPGDTTDDVIAALVAIPGVERGEAVAAGAPSGGPPMAMPTMPAAAMASPPVTSPVNGAGPVTLRLYIDGTAASLLSPVVSALSGRGAELSNVHIGEPSLEDVFIDLTGRSLR
ncbi:MAG TPA: ABC transporter ATP-binding protein [Acidimicrobiia bacterium]|nr:ABC transporter ATP-binding protein [Acidimicrobiia bacterium]